MPGDQNQIPDPHGMQEIVEQEPSEEEDYGHQDGFYQDDMVDHQEGVGRDLQYQSSGSKPVKDSGEGDLPAEAQLR